ncbi:alpha/beta fold hydrolase [Parasphingopyxis lamellibrachiae]|uniref:Pimeloyl-ACP methyl ester carboxylesterase n=1 Tax=Parasphingopyxis lamellibrachiae TaxID=680125 RepID=A0A3D9FF36_9SPHN|nr:alpha/beta hydrolase [Parasphingopyxis lamellibrachiae]RED16268.1 pimeloyl-ACP methyl ester carboxylesterase [Parasphingopyxis lamellibrachiae]
MQLTANGISLEVEDHGDRNDPALLLIMGFSGQLSLWPDAFVDGLVDRGFRVIRFDNRDIGLSDKLHGVKAPHPIWQLLVKRFFPGRRLAPYRLTDMAADAVGVLDALEIARAHVLGVSMGGMISQILAADYPERVSTLMPVMTSTNAPGLPGPDSEVRKALIKAARNRPETAEEALESGMNFFTVIGSPGGEERRAEIEELIRKNVERSFYPEGPSRQMAAIIDTGNLRPWASRVQADTVVIHGADDPLIPYACGEDVAAHIDGARFALIDGMGHDLPQDKHAQLTDTVAEHCLGR